MRVFRLGNHIPIRPAQQLQSNQIYFSMLDLGVFQCIWSFLASGFRIKISRAEMFQDERIADIISYHEMAVKTLFELNVRLWAEAPVALWTPFFIG